VDGEEVIQNIAETLADDFDRLRISLQVKEHLSRHVLQQDNIGPQL